VSLEALICSLPKKVAGSGKESTRRFWLLSSVPLHAGGEFRCDIGSLGPGVFSDINDDRAHGRDERVEVKEFYAGVDFYYRLVKILSTKN